jgi:hypothetical protein
MHHLGLRHVSTLAVLGAAAASLAAAPGPLTTADVTSRYEQWLFRRYPGPNGHWVCPVGDRWNMIGQKRDRIYCLAEFVERGRWHLLSTNATIDGRRVRFSADRKESFIWRRRWRTVPHAAFVPFGLHGSATVNAPLRVHDWPWLLLIIDFKRRAGLRHWTQVSSDGPIAFEFFIFERFSCSAGAKLVVCATPLGDALRYTP